MAVLQFEDEDVWRRCCDLPFMRLRFGEKTARLISHRLQQLEAMATVDDLEFLPVRYKRLEDEFEVTVDDQTFLLLRVPRLDREESHVMSAITIYAVRTSHVVGSK